MSEGSNYLDPDRSGAVRLSVGDARALGEAALARIGYGGDDGRIITDQLIDNTLCGYRFAGRRAQTRNLARSPSCKSAVPTSRARRFRFQSESLVPTVIDGAKSGSHQTPRWSKGIRTAGPPPKEAALSRPP